MQAIKQQKTAQDKKNPCKLTEKTYRKRPQSPSQKSEDEEALDLLCPLA